MARSSRAPQGHRDVDSDCHFSMTNADIQILIAQARSEADNPAFKVCTCHSRSFARRPSVLVKGPAPPYCLFSSCVKAVANLSWDANRLISQCMKLSMSARRWVETRLTT